MNYKEEQLDDILLQGISLRVNNKAPEKIAQLWQKFQTKNVIDLIPHKVSQNVYCVYTDYESDYKGDYTLFIGCEVSSLNANRETNIQSHVISKGNFYTFDAKGELPDAVIKNWQHIWTTDYPRAYKSDFEIYYHSEVTQTPVVKTYLSIN